jgi:hypothetical protein
MANRIQKVTEADLSSYGIDESQVEGLEVGCYEVFELDEADENGFTHDLIDTGGLSVNCCCLVVARTLEEAQQIIDQTDPEASGCNDTHLWVEAMDSEGQYEIGGQCVRMTASQAAAWNAGDLTEEALRGATIFLPSRSGGRSYVRDGEVVVEDGLPTGESVSLWSMCEDEKFYAEYLEGNPARRIA